MKKNNINKSNNTEMNNINSVNKISMGKYGTDTIDYVRELTKYMRSSKYYDEILKEIPVIDYLFVFHKDKPELLTYLIGLRDALEEAKDSEEKQEIKDKLAKYEPGISEKYAILSDFLLSAAEYVGYNLGVSNGSYYVFNGYYWDNVPKELVKELVLNAAMKSGLKEYGMKVISRIENMLTQFTYSSIIPNYKSEENVVKINLKNGTFVIQDGQEPRMEPFNSSDFLKYQLSFDYDPTAEAPLFMKFLNEVLPEKASQMILSEYIGYVLTRNLKLEKCLVLVGPGGNGKSVVFDIVSALLGKNNICSYSLSNLCNENGYFRAYIGNKILNYCSELGGRNCNPDTVKQLISGETVSARLPYGEPFEVDGYCKFMFNTNSALQGVEHTKAYFRRFIFLDFGVEIPEGEQDKNLAKKIIEKELSGIFNWVLEGLKRIKKNMQFTESPSSIKMLNEMKKETDPVAMFMDENGYEKSNKKYVISTILYKEFENFCHMNGHKTTSSKTFLKRLEALNFDVRRRQTNNKNWVYCERVIDLNDESTDEAVKQAFDL